MYNFGIDIGGTTIKIGFFKEYTLIDSYEIKTKKTLFNDLKKSLKEYLEKNNISINNLYGIGFGIPGNVINNYIYKMPNIGIDNINLEDEFKDFNVIIKSCNDATVAALAEANYSNYKNIVMLTLGTGVGGGIVINSKVIDGCNGAGGEVGHIKTDFIHNYECSCGLNGCLETVSSSTGIVRLAKEYRDLYKDSLIKNFNVKEIIDCAKMNDKLGEMVVDEAAKNIAIALANIGVTVDPDCYIIGGGISKAGNYLIDKISYYYKKYAHYAIKNTKIILAKLSNNAGMIGACYLLK